jgi:hypothetical protein
MLLYRTCRCDFRDFCDSKYVGLFAVCHDCHFSTVLQYQLRPSWLGLHIRDPQPKRNRHSHRCQLPSSHTSRRSLSICSLPVRNQHIRNVLGVLGGVIFSLPVCAVFLTGNARDGQDNDTKHAITKRKIINIAILTDFLIKIHKSTYIEVYILIFAVPWCNGSTWDFRSYHLSSILSGTRFYRFLVFEKSSFLRVTISIILSSLHC